MKARLMAIVSGLGVLLGLSGCLEVEEVLTLKKDGSGTISEEVVMGAQMVAMMEMGAAQGGGANPMAKMYDEEKYKKKAASYGEGVEYVKLEKVERNGGKGVKAHYKFADINTVVFEPGAAMDSMENMGPPGAAPKKEAKESQPLKFVYAEGKLTITFPDPPEDVEKPDIPEQGDNPEMAQMMAMFKDMRIGAKLVIEPGIASTNATHVDGNTITLMKVDFGKILENPDGMKTLQKLDMKNRKKMKAALKDVKGVKIETRKKVKVKVK